MENIKGVFIESDPSILEKYKNSFAESFNITIFNDTNSSLAYIIENNINIYFYIVRVTKSNEDSLKFFADKIKNIEDNQKRQYSRVNWPLHVIVSYKDKSKDSIDRNILSISGNGAYICSDINIPNKGDMLGLTISFKDFKLFTEAKVVWINDDNKKPDLPKGFAVQFIDIGLASQKIIDQIIRDKLLQEILIEYKEENFS